MNPDHYNWASGPPDGGGPRMLQIVRAPWTGHLELIALSSHLEQVWQHYIDGRTVGCTIGYGCRCEEQHVPTRRYFYLGCSLTTKPRIVLAQITEVGVKGLYDRGAPGAQPGLRGLYIRLSRDHLSRGGKQVSVILPQSRHEEGKLPAAPNIRAELVRIWNSRS